MMTVYHVMFLDANSQMNYNMIGFNKDILKKEKEVKQMIKSMTGFGRCEITDI